MASVRPSLLLLCVLLWAPAIHALHGPNVCIKHVATRATRTLLRYYTCPIQKITRSYVDSETYTVNTPNQYCCDGYQELQNQCKPVCSQSCTNGFCSAPGTCQCNSGYTRTSARVCEPICSGGCVHGTCTSPNTCTCAQGYQKRPGSNNVCVPVCARGCAHGTCTSPGVCTCDTGFANTAAKGNARCKPVCTRPCEHGTCTAPDTCTCNPGYEKGPTPRTQSCTPKCSNGCTNGVCSAPETCVCDEFYVMDSLTGQCMAENFEVNPE